MAAAELRRRRRDQHALDPRHRPRRDEGGDPQPGYDHRISKNTIEGYDKKTIPALVAGGQVKQAFDAATIVDPQFYKHVEATAPQFFSDLQDPRQLRSDPETLTARGPAVAKPGSPRATCASNTVDETRGERHVAIEALSLDVRGTSSCAWWVRAVAASRP